MKNNIDLKDKINNEKQNYEKEELREKYQTLDSLFRTELLRKDEQIRSVQSIFEN